MVGQYGFCHSLLDELPELDERSLEAMRQPLEDHIVTISHASGTLTFLANFQLIAAMNPCPCGYWGDPTHNCSCSPAIVTRYQKGLTPVGQPTVPDKLVPHLGHAKTETHLRARAFQKIITRDTPCQTTRANQRPANHERVVHADDDLVELAFRRRRENMPWFDESFECCQLEAQEEGHSRAGSTPGGALNSKQTNQMRDQSLRFWEGPTRSAGLRDDGRVGMGEWLAYWDKILSSPEMYDKVAKPVSYSVLGMLDRNNDGKVDRDDYASINMWRELDPGAAKESFQRLDELPRRTYAYAAPR